MMSTEDRDRDRDRDRAVIPRRRAEYHGCFIAPGSRAWPEARGNRGERNEHMKQIGTSGYNMAVQSLLKLGAIETLLWLNV